MKKLTIIIVAIAVLGLPQHSTHANWGEVTANFQTHRIWLEVEQSIRDATTAFAKQATFLAISQTMQDLLVSQTGEPLVITDPFAYIYIEPGNQADAYLENFFTSVSQGRSSHGDYYDFSTDSGETAGLTYEGTLVSNARRSLNPDSPAVIDARDYCPFVDGQIDVFADGNLLCFDRLLSPDALNNKISFELAARQVRDDAYDRLVTLARDNLVRCNGFRDVTTASSAGDAAAAQFADAPSGVGASGRAQVITPCSLVSELQEEVITLPIREIANADNEFATLFLEAVVSEALSDVMQQGIAGTRERAQTAIHSSIQNIESGIGQQIQIFGPEARLDPYRDFSGPDGG